MSSKRSLMVAGLTMVLVAGLGACGGGSGKDDDPWSDSAVSQDSDGDSGQYDEDDDNAQETTPTPSPTTVTGLRNAVRHLPTKTAKATRPHMVTKCSKSTKGSRKCRSVSSGTETYTRVVRQERWCVSLDDVDGDTAKDAVWYQVTRAAYDEAAAADHLAPLEFTPAATSCNP